MPHKVSSVPVQHILKYRVPEPTPFRLKDLVCQCDRSFNSPDWPTRSHYRPGHDENNFQVCLNCKRLAYFLAHICTNCEIPFVRVFQHPEFCIVTPECWDCCEIEDGNSCSSCYRDTRYEPPPEWALKLKDPIESIEVDEVEVNLSFSF